MAEIVRRRSWGGVLPLGRHVSISGSSFIQCASASIAPPHPGGPKCYPGAEVQGRTGSNGGVYKWREKRERATSVPYYAAASEPGPITPSDRPADCLEERATP